MALRPSRTFSSGKGAKELLRNVSMIQITETASGFGALSPTLR
jgi:hypothetical protein